jgi:hypothetical protein
MATRAKKKEDVSIEIQEIEMGEVRMNLLGSSPMIMNRFAFKAWQELLFPSVKLNRTGLEQSLKHDPFAEYKGAVYLNRPEDSTKTAVHLPTGSIHGAIAAVALDIPGTAKAKIERLTKVVTPHVDLYGIPEIFCAMVRNSDQNRTPDVRTRPIFPRWGCSVVLRYVKKILSERTIWNLAGGAGQIIGIGDWRGQKGGPFGSFELVTDDDVRWVNLLKNEGKAAQLKALEHPNFHDHNTEELLVWFREEVKRREMEGQLGGGKRRRKNGKDDDLVFPDLPVIVESIGADGQANYEGLQATVSRGRGRPAKAVKAPAKRTRK